MQGSLVFGCVMPAGMPVAYHHVCSALQNRGNEVMHPFGRVGHVRVSHHFPVCIHFEERAAHGVPFTLPGFVKYLAPCANSFNVRPAISAVSSFELLFTTISSASGSAA